MALYGNLYVSVTYCSGTSLSTFGYRTRGIQPFIGIVTLLLTQKVFIYLFFHCLSSKLKTTEKVKNLLTLSPSICIKVQTYGTPFPTGTLRKLVQQFSLYFCPMNRCTYTVYVKFISRHAAVEPFYTVTDTCVWQFMGFKKSRPLQKKSLRNGRLLIFRIKKFALILIVKCCVAETIDFCPGFVGLFFLVQVKKFIISLLDQLWVFALNFGSFCLQKRFFA
jgi:hypothetical protein